MGRKRIYDSDDPVERARMAKQKYEQTQKAKERKQKYLARPEVRQKIRQTFRAWYKRKKQNQSQN